MAHRQVKPEILTQAAGAFDIPGRTEGLTPYGNGHINDTFLAEYFNKSDTGGGDNTDAPLQRYIFQRINTKVFRDPLALTENIARVTGHLRHSLQAQGLDADRRTLTLIGLKNPVEPGAERFMFTDTDGGHWRCYKFIENSIGYESLTSGEQAYEASRCFGDFLARLADLPAPRLHETIPDFHNTPARYGQFDAALAGADPQRRSDAAREIDFVLARRARAGRLVDMQRAGKLPERISHNDTKINNVLFDRDGGEGLCVIDLDTVMPSLALYDFGDSVRLGANPAAEDERDLSLVRLDLELFSELTRGFLEGTSAMLTPAERDEMVFSAWLITLEIGLRFLSDYLAGDVYFRTARPGHNLDRCRTQFRLVECIEAADDKMRKLVEKL